jgi:chemotaxis protein MotB
MSRRSNGPAWLLTYADMMSLLLAVFVLLFAISSLEIPKYESAAESLRKSLDGPTPSQQQQEFFDRQRQAPQNSPINDLKPLYESLIETFQLSKQNASLQIEYIEQSNEIRVTFPEAIAFAPGRAELKTAFSDMLGEFKGFEGKDVVVKAIGHTDRLPVVGGRFNSNWELSSARAANVILELVHLGIIQPVQGQAIGLADTQPLSLGDSVDELAKNRRVEVLISPAAMPTP